MGERQAVRMDKARMNGRANKQAGKALERSVAKLLGGFRYPADIGGDVDVESEAFVVQCKHVQRMSLSQIEGEALRMGAVAERRGKIGAVAIKRRSGKGMKTPVLLVLVGEE